MRLGRLDNVFTPKCMVSIYEKIDLTIQRQKSKDMYITRTALIHLVTRATNRVPAGSDTGYFNEALEPLGAY